MKLVVKMLLTLGYADVHQAWNGQEAVDRVTEQGERPDLIFMDNIMPILTGPQACKIILAHYRTLEETHQAQMAAAAASASSASASVSASTVLPAAPIIIALTASCMEQDKQEATRMGHADFLAKPLSLPLLKTKLHHWAKWIHRRDNRKKNKATAITLTTASGATTTPAATTIGDEAQDADMAAEEKETDNVTV